MGIGVVGGENGQTLTRYLEALAQQRRRYTLYYLYDRSGGNVADLSKYVLSREQNRPTSEFSEKEQKSMQAELHHNHLPHLEDGGLISYDERTGDVSLEELPMPFLTLLGMCQAFERPS